MPDLICPNCGASASLPLEMTCADHKPVRVLTADEVDQMRAAWQDPDYVARLAADARQANSVEVDNPFRREIRPRRGTEDFRSPDTKEER